ncbi:MAG: hypothetical protein H8E73_09615 [Planctomycetes bacterium]|nr:hypothetical protein [Planctomycetota bacterium]
MQGGAISAGEGEVSVANCLFVGNYALFGGALFAGGNQLRIENCTFTDNRASEGKTVFDGVGYIYAYPLELHVENSIIWDGPDSIVLGDDATLVVTFCDMPGVGPGYGNIDADPCFVNPGYWDPNGTPEDANDDFYVAGDCHLRSQAGRWNPVSQTWVNDDVTSACIDAANPDSPLDQEPFPNGGRANIGAYGTTTRASKSYFGNPPCETIVAGDVNGDCIIDARDFALLAGNWLISSPPPGRATNPDPPDGATDVDHLSFVSWTPGEGAASHDVYFGTTSPGTFQRNQTGTTFDRSPLAYQTTYYWRIDEVNATSTTTGTVWSFTTGERKARLCFPADTLVWADGKPVPIIEVRPGQKVRMVDSAPDADGKFLPIVETRPGRQVSVFNNAAEVEWLQEHGVGAYDCYDMTFETGNTIVVVHSHNFLTVAGQWVAVENLPSGSQLQSLNGPITVTSVVKRAMPFVGNAYNLKIKSANLFFVGKDGVAAVDCSKLPKE